MIELDKRIIDGKKFLNCFDTEKLAKKSYGGNKYLQNDNGVTPYGILCEYLLWILIFILLIAQLLLVMLY